VQIRWSPAAANDLTNIVLYLGNDSAETAADIAGAIFARAEALTNFPNRGRIGRIAGTRELPLAPLPFVLVYRVLQDAVEIVNIIHGAQRWP
jgi:addiction module RelE/StbE family toxin